MSTATKLEYLNTTKEKIRDSINLTGANLTSEDTFRSYASKLKKGYIDIINNGIDTLYNNFPKVSGIGSNLSLTPTYEAPMKLNEIQGDTLQDGTPTPDSPVEIQSVTGLQNIEVCGKNLISSIEKSGNRLFFNGGTDAGTGTFKKGTYTISYTSQNTITAYIKNTDGTQTNLGTNKTITFTSNKDFDLWLYRSGITIEEVSNIQLEQGSTATDYEPYNSNTYEVNLGKNLFSSEMELGTLNNSTGLPATETNCIRTKDYISVNPSTTYIISNNKGYQQIVYQYDSSYNLLLANTQNSSFITTSTTKYIKLRTGVSNVENDLTSLWQLEKGTQATSYSPYFTPIELNKIGDYKDSIKKSTGKNLFKPFNFTKTSSNITFTYSEDGSINCNGTSNGNALSMYTSDSTPYLITLSAGTYTISGNTNDIRLEVLDSSGNALCNTSTTNNFTINSITKVFVRTNILSGKTINNIKIYPQLELGTATSYEPYGKVWYIEKNIGKVILDGSEAWGYDSNSLFFVSSNAISNYSRSNNIPYCDYYKGVSNVNGGSNISNNQIALNTNTSNDRLYIKNSNITNQNNFTTWLSTHNTEVLYVLATPTYTEITNTELIEDLETLYTAKSQEGTTNISITSEDLEMILNVSALKGDVE